jgi:hypothetical protein
MTIRVMLPAPLKRENPPPALRSHPRRPMPQARVLGMIDNTKTRAADVLEALGRHLVQRGLVAEYFVWQKPSPGKTITSDACARMLARAHVIVSGIGD